MFTYVSTNKLSFLQNKILTYLKKKINIEQSKDNDYIINSNWSELDNFRNNIIEDIIIFRGFLPSIFNDKANLNRIMNDKVNNYMPLTIIGSKNPQKFIIDENKIWLEKDRKNSCGRNINIIKNKKKWNRNGYILQEYIIPYTIDSKKIDLRTLVGFYIIVDNFHDIKNLKVNLKYFVEKDSLIRKSHLNFDISNNDMKVHLTNTSIQKIFSKNDNTDLLINHKILYNKVFDTINNIINDTMVKYADIIKQKLLNVHNTGTKISFNKIKFISVFGYDFMIDNQYNVYLLEINTRPGTSQFTNSQKYYDKFCYNFSQFLIEDFFI